MVCILAPFIVLIYFNDSIVKKKIVPRGVVSDVNEIPHVSLYSLISHMGIVASCSMVMYFFKF